jgi:hypothetical protein
VKAELQEERGLRDRDGVGEDRPSQPELEIPSRLNSPGHH